MARIAGGAGATFAVTGCAAFMAALDNLVVTTALPTIRADLDAGLDALEWTVNAYTLAFAVFLLTAAAIGDRFGRKRTFLAGIAVFTVASAGAALATSTVALVAARAVQGLGAAVLLPLSLTLLVGAVSPERRAAAIAGLSAMAGLGIALGPLVGGAVVQLGSWEAIFWLNVPIGLVLLPAGVLVLGAGPPTTARLDVRGTVLVTLGLLGVTYALVRTGVTGWGAVDVVGALVAGVLLLAGFLFWQFRAPAPLVPSRLITHRGFALAVVVALFSQGGMFGAVFLLTQFLQDVLGYSPLDSGVRTLPWTLAPVAVAPLAVMLADRLGLRAALVVATALQAVGLGWFAMVAAPGVPYAALVPGMLLVGAGMGLFFALSPRQMLELVHTDEHGITAGINNAVRQVGVVLGIAVLGSVFAAAGGYLDAADFVAGLRVALWTGVAAVGVAFVAVLLAPRRRRVPAAPVVGSSTSV